jgi:putative oxidoreductase
LNQGAPAVFYCFTFLYFSAAGPGPWSLDALLARPRSAIPVS